MTDLEMLTVDDIWIEFSESRKNNTNQTEKNTQKVEEWTKLAIQYGLLKEKKTNSTDYRDKLNVSSTELVIHIPKKQNYLYYLYNISYIVPLISLFIYYEIYIYILSMGFVIVDILYRLINIM